ncbi:MAG: hypothetical protein E6H66_04250 [Betaproteobacteria bacterium]|nr:MAG: hypothetical protein E6H66_04250 [Betaproteobacteria bacterium]
MKFVFAALVALVDERFDAAAGIEGHLGPTVENLRPSQRQLEIEPPCGGLAWKAVRPFDEASKHSRIDQVPGAGLDQIRGAVDITSVDRVAYCFIVVSMRAQPIASTAVDGGAFGLTEIQEMFKQALAKEGMETVPPETIAAVDLGQEEVSVIERVQDLAGPR